MTIGDNIKTLRKQKGLTQIQLANKAKISRSYLADVENNRYNASVETLSALASALGCDINQILVNDNTQTTIDPDIRRIERARKNMTLKDRDRMMKILEASFDEYFND